MTDIIPRSTKAIAGSKVVIEATSVPSALVTNIDVTRRTSGVGMLGRDNNVISTHGYTIITCMFFCKRIIEISDADIIRSTKTEYKQ